MLHSFNQKSSSIYRFWLVGRLTEERKPCKILKEFVSQNLWIKFTLLTQCHLYQHLWTVLIYFISLTVLVTWATARLWCSPDFTPKEAEVQWVEECTQGCTSHWVQRLNMNLALLSQDFNHNDLSIYLATSHLKYSIYQIVMEGWPWADQYTNTLIKKFQGM